MEKSYIKSIIEGLKSSSSSRVQESLLKIRSKIIVNDEGIKSFRDCGGLECLLPHLRKPNERILDITLSILGNCCLEEESSLTVGRLNSFGPLVTILKTVCRDSIVGRTCRLIGNLAQKNTNAEALHNHGTVPALITLIEKRDRNTSYPTLTMAVRAVRQLWMVIEKRDEMLGINAVLLNVISIYRQLWMVTEKRDEMLGINAVRCISILLTAECESAGIIKSSSIKDSDGLRKSQEELIIGILKCLGYFTTHCTTQCAEQIQGDGRGYQCLVALTKTYESLALKCLMNLCYLSSARPILGTAGLVECIVGILKKISEVSWWPEGASRALAQLSGESVNRSRLRHAQGLPLLLAAAKTNQHAMYALLQYVFDDTSFQILVNEGLINLLTDELMQYLSTMDCEHSNIDEEPIYAPKTNKSKESTSSSINSVETASKTTPLPQGSEESDCCKGNLFMRRRQSQFASKNEDELRLVIERDNMIVGFVDAVDSDASDDSHSDDQNTQNHRKGLKRTRSLSPKTNNKTGQLIKMANKDWSAGVYWEPKSPEWPTPQQSSSSKMVLPDRSDRSPLSPYSDGNQSGFSPEYRNFTNKRARLDRSPESGVSTGEGSSASPYWTEYQWSPSSSASPQSPFSVNNESSDSEMSGRYSPVCSEPEGGGGGEGAEAADLDAAQVAQHLDDLIMDDNESVGEDPPLEEDMSKIDSDSKTSRIACVLVLFFRVTHGACHTYGTIREESVSNHALELLTGSECLNALLDYVERCKLPLGRAARILARVLSNALCLMSILKHRIVLRLHNMSASPKHPINTCLQCKQIVKLSSTLLTQLTILAESSYGIGEISYQLLKGHASVKQTLSVTLPHIVKTEKPLKTYFVDCDGLNLLFTLIAEAKEEVQDCVVALAKFANNVQIKDPKLLEKRFTEYICVSYDPVLDNLNEDEIVTFELDDHSKVRAHKVFLCQNSDVFSAMLTGPFKESVESCVRLKNVTKSGFEYLLSLLHLGVNNPNNQVQVFPLGGKLEINLEVLLLADRFLFDRIKELLSSAIIQYQFKPNTADKIYIWSLSEGMGFMCVESVAYILTGDMNDIERTRSFETLLNTEYKEQWLDDVKTIILRQLEK